MEGIKTFYCLVVMRFGFYRVSERYEVDCGSVSFISVMRIHCVGLFCDFIRVRICGIITFVPCPFWPVEGTFGVV